MSPIEISTFYSVLGDRLKQARTRLNMSQDSLAKAIGLSRPSIVNIEMGRQRVQVHHLFAFGNLLNIPLVELLPSDNDIHPTLPDEIANKLQPEEYSSVAKLIGMSGNKGGIKNVELQTESKGASQRHRRKNTSTSRRNSRTTRSKS